MDHPPDHTPPDHMPPDHTPPGRTPSDDTPPTGPERRARPKRTQPQPPPPAPSTRYRRAASGTKPGADTGSSPRRGADSAVHSAQHADAASARFEAAVVEIASLLEGAMRSLSLSRAGLLDNPELVRAVTNHGVARGLDEACATLEKISSLLHAAMRPNAGALAQALPSSRTLLDAFRHAADCLTPLAQERGVRIELSFDDSLDAAPAGALYSVVLGGLRNALEASGPGGVVRMQASLVPLPAGRNELHAEILDEGVGPPTDALHRVFEHGFSAKRGHMGLGLSLAHEIIRELGGSIELHARMDGARRRGALLRFRCPVPAAHATSADAA